MIGVDEIQDILKIALYSGALEGEKPLSVILISSVGGGKTNLLQKTQKPPKIKIQKVKDRDGTEREIEVRQIDGSVLYTTKTTPYVLYTRYGKLLKSGQIKHLVVPDFLTILNLPRYQMMDTISFYNSLIEEGIMAIESRDGSFVTEFPVTVGLLTGIARQDFNRKKDEMAAIGFLSRALPVSWHYNSQTAQAIRDSVKAKEYLTDISNFNINLPSKKASVGIPSKLANVIEQVALATRDSNDEIGARRQKQLQTFCMSNALMENRTEVNIEDIKKLRLYQKFFNYDCSADI